MDQDLEVLLALNVELQTELRARRDSEHLYTAAFIGASGAVAWGVATIATVQGSEFSLVHPAIAGLLMIWLMAVAIAIKSYREHLVHRSLRAQVDKIGASLQAKSPNLDTIWPHHLMSSEDKKRIIGTGKAIDHRVLKITGLVYSLVVIVLTSVGATLFCLAIYFR